MLTEMRHLECTLRVKNQNIKLVLEAPGKKIHPFSLPLLEAARIYWLLATSVLACDHLAFSSTTAKLPLPPIYQDACDYLEPR